jgi:heme oxygenase
MSNPNASATSATPELSPAARAIVAAFDERYELLGPLETHWQDTCLAAALTALAVRIKGADAIRQDVLDIVNELERCNG